MVGIGLVGLLELALPTYLKLLSYLRLLAYLAPAASLTTLFVLCMRAYGISVVMLLWKGISDSPSASCKGMDKPPVVHGDKLRGRA